MSKASRILVAVVALAIAAMAGADTIRPFQFSQVRLDEGIFKSSMETNLHVLDEIGTERALYAFKRRAPEDRGVQSLRESGVDSYIRRRGSGGSSERMSELLERFPDIEPDFYNRIPGKSGLGKTRQFSAPSIFSHKRHKDSQNRGCLISFQ